MIDCNKECVENVLPLDDNKNLCCVNDDKIDSTVELCTSKLVQYDNNILEFVGGMSRVKQCELVDIDNRVKMADKIVLLPPIELC